MFEHVPGVQFFHQIQIEQTTPTGTVAFLAVMVSVFMLGAIALYVAAMTVVWYLRFRGERTPLHRVFLPSAAQVRKHAAEYSLAVATSLILMLSLMAKHATVEYLKATLNDQVTREDCEGALDLGHVFPLHACPPQLAAVTVGDLLEETAAQGQTSEAEFIVKRLYQQEQERGSLPVAWITETRLRLACLLLLLVHVLWLVRGRSEQLAAHPDGGEGVEVVEASRPLLALSLCAALLLLAAPAVLPTPDNVAGATMASMQDAPAAAAGIRTEGEAPPTARIPLAAAFERQRHNLGLLEGDIGPDQNDSLFAVINRVRDRVEQVDVASRNGIADATGQVQALADVHRRDIDGLLASQGSDRERLAMMETAVELHAGGLRDLQDALARAESSLQADIDSQLRRLNDLQQALGQARAQADQANAAAQAATQGLGDLSGTVSQLDAGFQRLNTQVTREIASARSALADQLDRESQALKVLANRVSTLEGAGQNAAALARQLAQMSSGLSDLTTRVNNYHRPVNVQ